MLVKDSNGTAKERVDPRVKRTRELIVRAFNELVAQKGHSGLTVQEIAERATINRATFYAHFTDRYELFDYVISEAFREELGRRLPDSPGPSKENLKALVVAACDYLAGLNMACSRTDRQVPSPGLTFGKGYYSYDLGSWHIVALNSNVDPNGNRDPVNGIRTITVGTGGDPGEGTTAKPPPSARSGYSACPVSSGWI
jgi:AcrR family transcriptional regulator